MLQSSRSPRLSVRAAAAGLAAAGLLLASGCASDTMQKKSTKGAIIGGVVGAAAGAAIDDEKRGRGALIGAAVGAVTGGLIGHYLDKQKQELDAIPDADVQRREESLVVTFPGDVLFEQGSSALSAGAYQRLRAFADSTKRYPDTDMIVKGHTSSEGSADYNQQLSEDRAESVRKYLIAEGVSASRITAVGFGEQFPVASNDTPHGRSLNRRVEIEIRPNEALRERHEAEQGGGY